VTLVDRFWSKVDVRAPDECWPWQAALTHDGYGRFSIGHKQVLAHRMSWTLVNGDPGELFVLHTCDNRSCVNPNHLFLGTHLDNMDDRNAKGRQIQGERHHKSKLTENDVRAIRKLSSSTHITQARLAYLFNVHPQTIYNIVSGKFWKGV
jgi:hypothetical protein